MDDVVPVRDIITYTTLINPHVKEKVKLRPYRYE